MNRTRRTCEEDLTIASNLHVNLLNIFKMVNVGLEKDRENNGGLASMDSIESRWVFQDEYDSDINSVEHHTVNGDDGSTPRNVLDLDSEDEDDNAVRKLIRTGPRIDSFDVEALEVPGAQKNDFDVSFSSYEFAELCDPTFIFLIMHNLIW